MTRGRSPRRETAMSDSRSSAVERDQRKKSAPPCVRQTLKCAACTVRRARAARQPVEAREKRPAATGATRPTEE